MKRSEILKLSGLAGLCIATGEFFLTSCAAKNTEEDRPNILIISADNLGYGDLRAYNPESPIITPNIDRFATRSMRLANFYTAAPQSTASRGALLTGRVPMRNGLEKQLAGIEGNYGTGLRHSEVIIPGIIKRSKTRYATGAFGKWNVGFAPGSRPTERGFDTFLGHVSGNMDYYYHVYNGKHDLYRDTTEVFRDGEYSSDIFASAAIDFIKEKTASSDPWFVYLPFNAPHYPNPKNKKPGQPNVWQATDEAFKAYGLTPDETDPKKRYNAVVTSLDFAIGKVLKTLDSLGISENTFVFFFSDNGAFMTRDKGLEVASNFPHKGAKCYEGGIHVPAFARWPGKIKEGVVNNTQMWTPDLLVACAQLSGAGIPDDIVLDGKDPLPVLLGKTGNSPHKEFIFEELPHSAYIQGEWKIVRTDPDRPWELYNLREDISESKDLSSEMPEIVDKLNSAFISKKQEIRKAIKSEPVL